MSSPVVHPVFTNVDSAPVMAVGTIVWDYPNAKAYKYVKFLDAVTYKAGQVLAWGNTAATSVTNDIDGGGSAIVSTGNRTAGIATAVHTQNSYGFMQIAGVALVEGDGSVAAGEAVVLHSVNGQADSMADGEEEQVFGTALSTDDTANDPLTTSALFYCKLSGLV